MDARAIQRTVRQSARKMRLVIDTIRGKSVNEAYALLKFSKKRAARDIHKVLMSAISNARQDGDRENKAVDPDRMFVSYAVVNEGATLKRFSSAALGRATPIHKRTSTIEIRVASKETPEPVRRKAPEPAAAAAPTPEPATGKRKAPRRKKAAAAGKEKK